MATATTTTTQTNSESSIPVSSEDCETSAIVQAKSPSNEENPRTRWIVLAAACAVVFVGVGYTNTFGVFQQYYETKLFPERNPSELILIGSVASSFYMIFGAVAGRFADVCGYQTALGLGSILMIVGMFTASVSKEYYQFFLSQGLTFGLGVAFAYYPAISISRQYFGSKHHGMSNGVVVSGGALGGFILPYVVRVLLSRRGLEETFQILGYLATGLLVPSCFLLKPKEKLTGSQRGPILNFKLLKDPCFIVLIISGTIAMTAFLPRYFLLTPSAIHEGIDSGYAAWLLGIMNGLSIIGRIGIGMFGDRYGKLTALILSFVLCGVGHLIFWLPSTLVSDSGAITALFTLFVVYIGLLGSGFVGLTPVVVSDLFGSKELASKVGLLNSIMGLGVLAGPSAVYAIINSSTWWIGVLTSGLLMILGGLLMTAAYKVRAPER